MCPLGGNRRPCQQPWDRWELGLWTGLLLPALSSPLPPPAPELQAALQGTQMGVLRYLVTEAQDIIS